jgi:hypothetical protein
MLLGWYDCHKDQPEELLEQLSTVTELLATTAKEELRIP